MKFRPKLREKRWNPNLERRMRRGWEKEALYKFNPRRRKPIFSIDTPPPYPSGRPWHIGAIAQYSQIDMIARTARMRGFEVFFPIGIDRNGLPVEVYTEKRYGISMHETPRDKFIRLCAHALDDLEAEMIEIMQHIGMSGDFANYYRTDSERYRALTQATFIRLWRQGLIYQATRPNNWCVKLGTTIADAEVVYEEFPARLVYVKFGVRETGEELVIATTRPELLCACQAVLVHPDDARYAHLHGKHAIIPLYEREVPIIPHPAAKPEFGTGAVMTCSYGDSEDVRIFRELGLEEIKAIGLDGRMCQVARQYAGLTVKEAQDAIVQDLKRGGFVAKVEKITHRVPVAERSGSPIEIIPMEEWYLRQLEFRSQLKRLAHRMTFHPARHKQILLDWIDSISIDWPISRRRFYGTEIPIWYCKRCGKPNLPRPGRYYRPWREPPPFKRCRFCGGKEFEGEQRTFDTWVDSGISPLFIAGYPDGRIFHKLYPNTLRPQGKDIVRTWLYYTLLRCWQLTRKPAFRHVWIGGLGVDEKGEKMSKSKGNIIDPAPLFERYGADAFRFWNASEASLGSDFRCSEWRIAAAAKFLTKLWNVARFISSFPIPRKVSLCPADEWILGELNRLIKSCLSGYADFNFYIPANRIREFVWTLFAPHYVEMVKARAYGQGFSKAEQRAAWFALHTCLKTVLLLAAPLIPFITDHIWRRLYGRRSIHLERFPEPTWASRLTRLTAKLVSFNSRVWKMKKERGLALRAGITLRIPAELRLFQADLIAMHNLKP